MKKTLIITLIDGREIRRDISAMNVNAPIGAPANDQSYALLCQMFCTNGYTDIDQVSDTLYTHIAPSQIKTVAVKFEEINPYQLKPSK